MVRLGKRKRKEKEKKGGATLHIAFWETEVTKSPGEVVSASKESQKVSDGGGVLQKVF